MVLNTLEEFFNMKHSSARNIVIDKCFGLLKICWEILKSPSFDTNKTQCLVEYELDTCLVDKNLVDVLNSLM